VISSPDLRATDHRKQGVLIALVAVVMALVVVVGGAKTSTGGGNLGEATDHGLAGASMERGLADSLPIGKPINEATSETSEREREADDKAELATGWIGRVSSEPQWSADRIQHALDVSPALRARRSSASLGARGPPVG
jgi:hypothetical protein